MRRGGLLLGCAALAAAFACTDLSHLSGGKTDPDASTTDPDASTTGVEAGTDASPGSTGRFCDTRDAATTVFCDDFDAPDRVSLGQTGWQPESFYPPGELTTTAFSAPRSVSYRYGADGGSARSSNVKVVSFPSSKSVLVFSSRIFLKGGTDNGGFLLRDSGCTFRWMASTGDLSAFCNNVPTATEASLAAPTDTWSLVTILEKRRQAAVDITVTIGEGASAVTVTKSFASGGPPEESASFSLGNGTIDGAGAIDYDDIAVDVR